MWTIGNEVVLRGGSWCRRLLARISGAADKAQVMLDWRLIRPVYKEIS